MFAACRCPYWCPLGVCTARVECRCLWRRADRVAAAWKRRLVDWCERSIGECWVWRAASDVVGADGGLSGGEELAVASCVLRRPLVVT